MRNSTLFLWPGTQSVGVGRRFTLGFVLRDRQGSAVMKTGESMVVSG